MSAQVDLLIAQLRQQRASDNYEPVVAIIDVLIAALQSLDAAAGTVTSVGLTVPGVIFTSPVSGSPVTTVGTFALALKTQVANTLFAGPASGADATPAFRAAVAADINGLAPTFNGVNLLNGTFLTWNGGVTNSIVGGGSPEMIYNAGGSHDFRLVGASALLLTGGMAQFNGGATGEVQRMNSTATNGTFVRMQLNGTSLLFYGSAKATLSGSLLATDSAINAAGGGSLYLASPVSVYTYINSVEATHVGSDRSFLVGTPTNTGAGTITAASTIRPGIFTVGTLPAGADGQTAHVTDALAPAFGVAVAAGGAVHVPVYFSSGTSNWLVG